VPKNYYIVLGISSDSTQEAIKAAYRKLAKEFHPDLYGKHTPFLIIQEAYSVLSDPVRRKSYDNTLHENRKKSKQYRRNVDGMRGYSHEKIEPLIPEQGPVDLGSASLARSFQSYRPSFDSLFDRLFSNFYEREYSKGERLENLTVVIELTPEQAFRGGHVRLLVPAQLKCPDCGGRGGIGFYECWHCSGGGSFTGEYPVLISFPPGIPDNHSVQISLDRYGIRNLYLTVNFRISEMG